MFCGKAPSASLGAPQESHETVDSSQSSRATEKIQLEGDVEEQDCEKTPSIPVTNITQYLAKQESIKAKILWAVKTIFPHIPYN